MSIKKISENQPTSFKFSEENLVRAQNEVSKYPSGNCNKGENTHDRCD